MHLSLFFVFLHCLRSNQMKTLRRISLLILTILIISCKSFAQSVTFSVSSADRTSAFIPADQGAPNISTASKYIAIPKDAEFRLTLNSKSERITDNAYIAPAYQISHDLDPFDRQASEDSAIYSTDAFYPADIITTERLPYRDFDLVLVSIAIEQYNPVRRQLRTLDNIEVSCSYSQTDAPESHPVASPLFSALVVNPEFFASPYDEELIDADRRNGCNYLIITPDNEGIRAWADTLRVFRETQGLRTKILSIQNIGANHPDTLKAFLRYAYEEWSPVPDAVLLLGDYATDPADGITSYALEDHPEGHNFEPYMADNRLVDFNNDGLPDMVIARIPAADADQAALMVQKTLRYEREPYTDIGYYHHPTTAMGYQLKRWFQLCSEIIAGYFEANGRETMHLNAIHQGTPDSLWSDAQKTEQVLACFGPEGLGYIPATMSHITDWSATASHVTNALEDGTFLLVHRDHGTFQTWGEPHYNNSYINQLNNDLLTFVMSANCQTGDFSFGNGANDCMAERFMRIPQGAVGIIAASQLSYSYVNDTYVWGWFDYLFPDFMPSYGSSEIDFKYPAFANAYGKYFLHQSSFPSNGYLKTLTNNLFHYFGDAYLQLYTEVPRHLTVQHQSSVPTGSMQIDITADEGAIVALSVDGNLIARRKSNGNPMTLRFPMPLAEGTVVKVVATKQNHFRHESFISVGNIIGINEVTSQTAVLYPNPTTGLLHIEGQNIRDIIISNILGQPVKKLTFDSDVDSVDLDCSNLPDGVYVIRINGLQTRASRLIKN